MYAGQNNIAREANRGQETLADQFSLPTIPSPPRSPISSPFSQHSRTTHVHPPTHNMDDPTEGYTRRRAFSSLDQNGRPYAQPRMKADPRRHRRRDMEGSDEEASGKPTVHSLEDRHSSDFSSLPTSEDFEMEHYPSEGTNSNDEERGLAKKDKKRRKRGRARTATLNRGPPGSIKTAEQEQKLADKGVARALIINALLIASWYFYSVSISVVSHNNVSALYCRNAKQTLSTIDGCFHRAISTSTFLSLQPACTWSSNFS